MRVMTRMLRGIRLYTCKDLVARLAARGCAVAPPRMDEAGRPCGPPEPAALSPEEGSGLVGSQMRGFAAAVLGRRTVAELREICRLRGLATGGAKEELLLRLVGGTGSPPPRSRRRSAGGAELGSPARRESCGGGDRGRGAGADSTRGLKVWGPRHWTSSPKRGSCGPLSVAAVVEGGWRTSSRQVAGADGWTYDALREPPPPLYEALESFYALVERRGQWPERLLDSPAALLSKRALGPAARRPLVGSV